MDFLYSSGQCDIIMIGENPETSTVVTLGTL
jgi:hypothetical protein